MSLTPENSSAGWPSFGEHFNGSKGSTYRWTKDGAQVTSGKPNTGIPRLLPLSSNAQIIRYEKEFERSTLCCRVDLPATIWPSRRPASTRGARGRCCRKCLGFCPFPHGATCPGSWAASLLYAATRSVGTLGNCSRVQSTNGIIRSWRMSRSKPLNSAAPATRNRLLRRRLVTIFVASSRMLTVGAASWPSGVQLDRDRVALRGIDVKPISEISRQCSARRAGADHHDIRLRRLPRLGAGAAMSLAIGSQHTS